MADAAQGAIPLIRWLRLPTAIAVGMLIGSGAAPYNLWPLALLGYSAAFWLFEKAPRGIYAVGTGWGVGLGYFGLSLGWIVEPFLVDAATTGWMAPFGLLGLAGGLALFWALAFWGAAHNRRPVAALVVFWSAAELARAYVFTGFPWGLVGYVWEPSPAIQWVSVIGPHGLTLATLVLAALAARTVQDRAPLAGGLTIALLAVLLGGGAALTPKQADLSDRPIVRLVQPNAPQHEKWDPAKIPFFFDRQVALTATPPKIEGAPRPSLIVWPETSVPSLLERSGPTLNVINDAAQGVPVALGIQRSENGGYYNSMAVLDGLGAVAEVYDKHHLVPFGEYMPAAAIFKRWNIAGLAARAEGGYTPGPGPVLLNLGPLGTALPLICYEAVFPQDVHRAPARPDMLLQITNDAWFGKWSGPYQHLAQARIRAIEQGLPMLRAANTGVSAVIDGGGRIIDSLPLGQAGFVDAPLPPPARITLYSRTGDLPVLLILFLCTSALFLRVGLARK